MTIEPTARRDDECLRCGGNLTNHGVEQLRVGGTSGGWKMLLGEFAELGEGMIDLELRSCDRCRMVEFRAANG
ncbi:MAG: hypothetical protein ACJ77B_03680 [Chloroflexota bacterium]